ncbi:hypothetical protein [Amycolatopsis sp. EV170708-02-1]|uniref:hypothetical protein n=1 Tax=Amycolatopsis sp. EV170708-02-1 TaxID=2919322 RepID=UPI001F0CB856|nr:hypothetical protein [Amycolatopsis sp. EV170708-02-1]UMP00045.1 hypothetical protein MJQ72_26445 [Amycolatopsis sp. EV170708-02-1]
MSISRHCAISGFPTAGRKARPGRVCAGGRRVQQGGQGRVEIELATEFRLDPAEPADPPGARDASAGQVEHEPGRQAPRGGADFSSVAEAISTSSDTA